MFHDRNGTVTGASARSRGRIRALVAAAYVIVLAGCSAADSGTPPPGLVPQRSNANSFAVSPLRGLTAPLFNLQSEAAGPVRAVLSARAKEPGGTIGFLSDFDASIVYIVNTAGQVTGTLTGFRHPFGLAVDQSGNLYVADPGYQHIQVYAPPYGIPPTTLNDAGQYPTDVAVDTNGNVAACNYSGADYNPPPSVSFYRKGATNPSVTLTAPSLSGMYFCAFDSSGNLYLDGIHTNGSAGVGEVVGGINGTAITLLSLTPNDVQDLTHPMGVQVTTSGLIAIGNEDSGIIYSFNPPIRGALGDPAQTTDSNAYGLMGFAFTASNRFGLAADYQGECTVFAYPSGRGILGIYLPTATVVGAAVNPSESY